jgi:serine O-acetyltransferase
VLIGEAAVIGEPVRICQVVTLGAKSFSTDASGHTLKGLPHHPILQDELIIYTGATVFGRSSSGVVPATHTFTSL